MLAALRLDSRSAIFHSGREARDSPMPLFCSIGLLAVYSAMAADGRSEARRRGA